MPKKYVNPSLVRPHVCSRTSAVGRCAQTRCLSNNISHRNCRRKKIINNNNQGSAKYGLKDECVCARAHACVNQTIKLILKRRYKTHIVYAGYVKTCPWIFIVKRAYIIIINITAVSYSVRPWVRLPRESFTDYKLRNTILLYAQRDEYRVLEGSTPVGCAYTNLLGCPEYVFVVCWGGLMLSDNCIRATVL